VSGGGELNTGNNSASDPTTVGQLISVTVQTTPAGLSFTVDGTTYTSAQTFSWIPSSSHTIETTSPQGSGGTRFVFQSWSDAGAISHSVNPSTATTFTASFETQYQLTTAVSPVGSGTVTPVSGGFFAAGSSVPLQATANAGNTFANWTGPVAAAGSASTTVEMTGPLTVTANFTAGSTTMSAQITGKTGPVNARVWTLTLTNNGPGAANGARIDGLTLTQTFGTACTPVVSSSFPVAVGNLAPAGSGTGTVTINFTGCASNTRFRVNAPFSANGGAASGMMTLFNVFQ
jgi:hypothetical protein